MTARELVVLPDAEAVARAGRDAVLERAERALADRGAFHLALSGGSTPRRLHGLLAQVVRPADFARWHLWFGDERWVPADHPDSNFRLARETLLEPAARRGATLDAGHLHPVPTELADPPAAARAYEAELRAAFAPDPPALDLILLGMGDDGHTASLFPGSSALDAGAEELVVATHLADRDTWRVTLTFAAIAASRRVVFLVTGQAKGAALERVLGQGAGPTPPAARALSREGGATWYVDRAALDGGGGSGGADGLSDPLRR